MIGYCLPVDVFRLFDPNTTQSELGNSDFYGSQDEELMEAYIEDASAVFDEATGNPQRLTWVGGGPETYEYHDAEFRKFQGGIKVYLDHRNVLPIDHSAGDRIEVRTRRDHWKDLTSDTDKWRLNNPQGVLQLYVRRVPMSGRYRRSMINDNIRVKYRHGALGGTRSRSGQTDLSSQASTGDATLQVENADRLPNHGVAMVGDEYVRYSAKDTDADELTGVSRGVRGTSESSHDSGDAVHYCSLRVREAVAARVALDHIVVDDYLDELVETGEGPGVNVKQEELTKKWESACGRFSEAHML